MNWGRVLIVVVMSLVDGAQRIDLPAPLTSGGMPLSQVLALRRSVRSYKDEEPLSTGEISQLLWAAQGVTSLEKGYRTAPSAGAKYPLELYLATASGHYHYEPDGHHLNVLGTTDLRKDLSEAALGQEVVEEAPAVFVLAGVYDRTAVKYSASRAERYVQMETGHACENLLLQAVALGLGGVSIGAFYDEEVQEVLGLPQDHEPLYVIPVGRPE